MKSVKRLGIMLALVAIVGVLPAFGARAQGMTCTLAADDCKILSTADANVSKETSFNQDFSFSLKASGTSSVDVEATGSGLFGLDSGASMTDFTSGKGIKLTLDITASTKGMGSDQSGKTNLVIVDGVAYVNVNDGKGWQGVKLSDAMQAGGGTAGMMNNPAVAAFQDPAFLQALAAIPNIKGFITLTKTEAPDLDGQKMVGFTYALDLKTLATSKEIYPLIKAALKASGQGSADVPDDQLAQITSVAGKALADTTFTITRWVGATDNLYHALAIDLKAKIDPTSMGQTGDPTNVSLNLTVKLTKVGQPVDVKAPAGAKMVDMGGSSGSGTAATPAATPAQ